MQDRRIKLWCIPLQWIIQSFNIALFVKYKSPDVMLFSLNQLCMVDDGNFADYSNCDT